MDNGQELGNSHVETYLDYYCGLSHSPGFAILLEGKWGSGKTWFINNYRESPGRKQHYLYISLYGVSSLSEIDDKFFQLLHPIRSSKGMAITGIILKGLLKGALKLDLNNDGSPETTWTVQIPEINLPKHLDSVDKSILIFDDLERCNVNLGDLLGYVNYFVEQQGLKVILVANEDELIGKNSTYKFMKEKLVGKTLNISPVFEGALKAFITKLNSAEVRSFLHDRFELIKELYEKAEYKNLRNLKQIILDFERIFENLPERAKRKLEVLEDILKFLVAFSIEIRRGSILPRNINKLQEAYISAVSKQAMLYGVTDSTENINTEEENSLQKVLDRYTFLDIHSPLPSLAWWAMFFEQGVVDKQELEKSVSSSKYFRDENTPNWAKLWHFSNLSDDEFSTLISEVSKEYSSRSFLDLGIMKHIIGLLLMFSDVGIYAKSKQEILKESKDYVDYLSSSNQLDTAILSTEIGFTGGYLGLDFQGKEFLEFQEFCDYANTVQSSNRLKKKPEAAQEVLAAMQDDSVKFRRMLCLGNSEDQYVTYPKYYETPILHCISPDAFIESLLAMSHRDRQCAFWVIANRYKYEDINDKLIEELEWLESVQALLIDEVNRRKGSLSGFCLELLNTHDLSETIEKLKKNAVKLLN